MIIFLFSSYRKTIMRLKSLDLKDRRILSELDKNSRQTDAAIAKKVGLSKQVVHYRIQRLVKQGIIADFYSIVNVGKLGLDTYYIFLQLQKLNKQQEIDLMKRLGELTYVGWLVNGTGRWDACMIVYAESIAIFDKHLSEVLTLCGEHLHEYNFMTMITSHHISYKFLEEDHNSVVTQTERSQPFELGESDKQILDTVSHNARDSVVQLAKKLSLPIHVVRYNLQRLIKTKVLAGFKPKVNLGSLDYQWHLLLIQFQHTSAGRKKAFINYCMQHKNVYYVANSIGSYNFMFDLLVENSEAFKAFLLEIKEKFSDVIRLHESMIVFDEYKIDYIPTDLI